MKLGQVWVSKATTSTDDEPSVIGAGCGEGAARMSHHEIPVEGVDLDAIRQRQNERRKITHLHGNGCLTSEEGQQASDDCEILITLVERLRLALKGRQ